MGLQNIYRNWNSLLCIPEGDLKINKYNIYRNWNSLLCIPEGDLKINKIITYIGTGTAFFAFQKVT
jgi:hypothetical protein